MKKQAVIFDLDGTLLDTLEDLTDAANAMLEALGFPTHSLEKYRFFVGEGAAVLIRRIVPEAYREDPKLLEKALEMFLGMYGEVWNVKTRPYAGIPELLGRIMAREIPMAVLSNKPDANTQLCVDHFLSDWKFDVVRGHTEDFPRKPDPTSALSITKRWGMEPTDILYVGDTATDMETAVAARLFPVGVSWGFRPVEELTAAGAKAIAHHPRELEQWFD